MTTVDGTYNYSYDDIYQLTGVTYPDSKTISCTYDSLGNRLTGDNDGLISTGTYNELNQLSQLLYNGGTAGSKVTVRGNVSDTYGISSVTVNGVTANINDNLFVAENVSLTEGSNTVTAIALDNGGNTTETNISVTLDPQASITYTYDDNGNMTSKTVDGETTTYTYDYDNRLIAINNGLSAISYVYDPLGRRIEKNVNGTVTRYIYNGNQIIQETDSAGTIEATYVYGLGIDEPIVMERGGTTYYYYLDGLGSVTEITDSSANIVERYKYDPYGETTILDPSTETVGDSSSIDNSYMYTGRQLDEETGLYYYRNRYYDGEMGRFITADPIGYGDGLNLYMYTRNNPVNLIDPSGTRVMVCYSDWSEVLEIGHSFVMTTDTTYAGSWGFYPYRYDWITRVRIILGLWVPGKVRPYDYEYHKYDLGRKVRCKAETEDHSKDQCIYTTGWAEVARNDLEFHIDFYNCHDWRREILKRCGVGGNKQEGQQGLPGQFSLLQSTLLEASSGENINSSK